MENLLKSFPKRKKAAEDFKAAAQIKLRRRDTTKFVSHALHFVNRSIHVRRRRERKISEKDVKAILMG